MGVAAPREARLARGAALAVYVDMNTNFPSNGITWDNVHPNDNIGYPWMGDRWYATIKEYLH